MWFVTVCSKYYLLYDETKQHLFLNKQKKIYIQMFSIKDKHSFKVLFNSVADNLFHAKLTRYLSPTLECILLYI